MGPRLKLPRFVHGFVDRHGKPRFYFRRPGFESRTLHGLPYSAEFMSDYQAAMAGQPLPVGANRMRPGTMSALALSYFSSPQFRTLKPSTQRAYRGIIERLCREHGDKRAADLRRDHVVRLMAARGQHPGAANGLRMALRVMMKHAIQIGLRAVDPTREVRAIRIRTGGHHSWTGDPYEGPTHPHRRAPRQTGEDRRRADHSDTSYSCGHYFGCAPRPPNVCDHKTRWTVSGSRI